MIKTDATSPVFTLRDVEVTVSFAGDEMNFPKCIFTVRTDGFAARNRKNPLKYLDSFMPLETSNKRKVCSTHNPIPDVANLVRSPSPFARTQDNPWEALPAIREIRLDVFSESMPDYVHAKVALDLRRYIVDNFGPMKPLSAGVVDCVESVLFTPSLNKIKVVNYADAESAAAAEVEAQLKAMAEAEESDGAADGSESSKSKTLKRTWTAEKDKFVDGKPKIMLTFENKVKLNKIILTSYPTVTFFKLELPDGQELQSWGAAEPGSSEDRNVDDVNAAPTVTGLSASGLTQVFMVNPSTWAAGSTHKTYILHILRAGGDSITGRKLAVTKLHFEGEAMNGMYWPAMRSIFKEMQADYNSEDRVETEADAKAQLARCITILKESMNAKEEGLSGRAEDIFYRLMLLSIGLAKDLEGQREKLIEKARALAIEENRWLEPDYIDAYSKLPELAELVRTPNFAVIVLAVIPQLKMKSAGAGGSNRSSDTKIKCVPYLPPTHTSRTPSLTPPRAGISWSYSSTTTTLQTLRGASSRTRRRR